MNANIQKVSKDIETRLTKKFSQMLDKIINTEASRLKNEVEKEMRVFKDDIRKDVKCLQEQIVEVGKSEHGKPKTDTNLVIRNLPETEGESLKTKVQGLLRDGLKLRNVKFDNVVRKQSRQRGKPGIVIMTCSSESDKQSILENKRRLEDSRNYRTVYIHPDTPYEVRIQTDNMRTLLKSMQPRIPGLKLKGNRLVDERHQPSRTAGQSRDRVQREGTPYNRENRTDRGGNPGSRRSVEHGRQSGYRRSPRRN